MSAAVDIRDAFRIHRSAGGTAVALQGLSLGVDEGEIVVVLGPSGSGKTTLLRIVAGFDSLSAGTVHVLGEDMGRLSPGGLARFRAQNLGVLDQHYARALSPDLSSGQTVGLGLELLGEPRSTAHSAAAALLDRVGLGDRLDARPEDLSGGEQQRVALCAALVAELAEDADPEAQHREHQGNDCGSAERQRRRVCQRVGGEPVLDLSARAHE